MALPQKSETTIRRAKGAKYDSQGQARSGAERGAPGHSGAREIKA